MLTWQNNCVSLKNFTILISEVIDDELSLFLLPYNTYLSIILGKMHNCRITNTASKQGDPHKSTGKKTV